MIKAVIFDMDGLLIDSEPLWQKTNKKIFKRLGWDLTMDHHVAMRGRSLRENLEHYYAKQPWQGMTPAEAEQVIIKEMIKLVKSDGVLKPGVHTALQVSKKAGLPVAIASGSPIRLVEAVIDTLEIREHFHHIYSAQFEPYGKPHPGVFIKVAEHFKVRPADCLVFEDSPSGVLAAKAANMKCVAVPEPEAKDSPFIQTADVILDSLEEFDEALLAKLQKY